MLKNLVETAALMHPHRVVLTYQGDVVTITELVERAARVARHLQASGRRHCVYLGVNGPEVPLTLFAAILAGIPFAPLNYRLADDQLRALLDRIEEPLIVTDGALGDEGARVGLREWWALSADPALDGDDLDEVDGDAIATVLFTSGTTSAPKAVPLRHNNLGAYLLNTIELMGADPPEAALVSVPPYHVAAIGATLTNTLSGRRLVYLPSFTPQTWLETVVAEQVSSAMLVPTMLARITDHLDGAVVHGGSLRSLAYGGARTTPDLLARALRAFPEVDFTNAYGLTETASTTAVLGPDDHRDALGPDASDRQRARLGSVGRAIPGIEFLVRDEDGAPVPAGTAGSLFVRGAQVSGEYLGQQSGLDADGWFATRDGAWLDEDGYLYIVGRVDDTVELDASAVQEWVRERLRSSRTPDDVVFVSDLPYGPTGKLLRRDIAAQYTTSREAEAGEETS